MRQDTKRKIYLQERSCLDERERIEWAIDRNICRSKKSEAMEKPLLLQLVCGVLPTKVWTWERGLSSCRLFSCGAEYTVEPWLFGCDVAARVPAGEREGIPPERLSQASLEGKTDQEAVL